MRLVQFRTEDGDRKVGRVGADGRTLEVVSEPSTVYALSQMAITQGVGLSDLVQSRLSGRTVAYQEAVDDKRLLPPLDHPDPTRCLVSGTGLTHLGSADTRDQMHRKTTGQDEAALSDSLKMFRWGLDGGKPPKGQPGVQPEWFYKGDGSIVVPPEQPVAMPDFAEDGGEEAELTGLYVIGPDGMPCRVGYALGNEFSDHVMERRNYLYLAHSKLRQCCFGPELLVGTLPTDVRGTSRILRAGEVVWQADFLSGEDNMCHSLENLEYHHFKYPQHRRPWDVHVHFLGAATLSFTDDVRALPGDVFEISAQGFGRPLRNALAMETAGPTEISVL